jgi:predicted DNA-binding protein YlxM (UPF0122 family)
MPNVTAVSTFESINRLLDRYEKLLTKKQQQTMQAYFRYNLSLQEIADQFHISRAAVNDSMQLAQKRLLHYEAMLGCIKQEERLIETIKNLKLSQADQTRLLAILQERDE